MEMGAVATQSVTHETIKNTHKQILTTNQIKLQSHLLTAWNMHKPQKWSYMVIFSGRQGVAQS